MSSTVAATNGAASITPAGGLFAQTGGYHTLTVKAFDNAHNLSGGATYAFYISPDTTGTTQTVIEAETLVVHPASGPTGYTYDRTAASDSGGSDSQIVSNAPASFSYTVNAPSDGYYALGAQLLTGGHNATLGFAVNGTTAFDATGQSVSVNTCDTSTNPAPAFQPLGGFKLNAGPNTITVKLNTTTCAGTTYGTGPAGSPPNGYNDNGYSAGIDDVIVTPLGSTTFSSLQASFNNHGIGVDNTNTGASFDQSTADHAMSRSALTAVGITSGSTYSMTDKSGSSISFNIPAATANGDNTIAAGQTITIPTTTTAKYVDILVGSTCGDVTPNGAINVGMTFTGSTATYNPTWTLNATSRVPDWVKTPDTTVLSGHATADHYLSGVNGTPASTAVTLYLLKAPVSTDYNGLPLTAVTLPTVGTDFTINCDDNHNNALHVFAITTSAN